ncbi:MAG: hydroxymethylglutaryl-CoA synthase, partial [Kiritimatiellota bacterium]|nr:hydroxymethylglutaryl-CoA synthase [Kiritimatiellota bacterium]
KAGDRILMVSYGSGAGSDALDLRVTKVIESRQKLAPTTADYIARRVEIDYATYARFRGILAMK